MTLQELSFMLNEIIAEYSDADVVVEGWDDNAYDGDAVVGVRVMTDRDLESKKTSSTVFIIRGEGR